MNEYIALLVLLLTTTKGVQNDGPADFELYREDVYYFCYYVMKNQADAEDLCQEVFVKSDHG
ncbi:RNA polymerase sigma factor [Paenibacillus amylolyticus]|uniref:RNA polymerase sigma factor n=1 Tax=Paenibacillus amylolyticus TaxID=1451 RepID=UPI0037C9CA46